MRRDALVAALSAAMAVACSAPMSGSTGSTGAGIIGGRVATATDVPAVGAVLSGVEGQELRLWCSATLIAPDVIVTAAHCTEVFGGGPDRFFTRALDLSGATVPLPRDGARVTRVVPHPEFRIDPTVMGLADTHDVELMFLDVALEDVLPLTRPGDASARAIAEGAALTIAGYGQSSTAAAASQGILRVAPSVVTTVGAAELRVAMAPPQACHGDSGGPSILDPGDGRGPRLVGVTSRSFGDERCVSGAIVARVDTAFDWIAAEMRAGCARGERVACEGGGDPPEPAGVEGPAPDPGGCACVRGRPARRSGVSVVGAMMIGLTFMRMRGRNT